MEERMKYAEIAGWMTAMITKTDRSENLVSVLCKYFSEKKSSARSMVRGFDFSALFFRVSNHSYAPSLRLRV